MPRSRISCIQCSQVAHPRSDRGRRGAKRRARSYRSSARSRCALYGLMSATSLHERSRVTKSTLCFQIYYSIGRRHASISRAAFDVAPYAPQMALAALAWMFCRISLPCHHLFYYLHISPYAFTPIAPPLLLSHAHDLCRCVASLANCSLIYLSQANCLAGGRLGPTSWLGFLTSWLTCSLALERLEAVAAARIPDLDRLKVGSAAR
jgi:hypothetical protein